MSNTDPAAPENPNDAEETTVESTGSAPNDQDQNSDIAVSLPTPGGIDTAYSGSGTAQSKTSEPVAGKSASSGTLHSSFKGEDNTADAQISEWDGVINDATSATTPVAAITERRELPKRTTFGPGQGPGIRPGASPINPGPGQVPLAPADLTAPSEADTSPVWQPSSEDVVSDGTRVITSDLSDYPAVGEIVDFDAVRANPSVDITAREPAGSASSQDPNAETFQDDYRGTRKESTGWQPQSTIQKKDLTGTPTSVEIASYSGAGTTDRSSDFQIFAPPNVPVEGQKLKSAIAGQTKNQSTSANAGLGATESTAKVRSAGFTASAGAFYGVDEMYVPVSSATESAELGPTTLGNITLVAKTMPGPLVTQGRVSSVSADIRNTSDVLRLEDVHVSLDVIDSSGTKYSVISSKTNIPPARAVALTEVLPAAIPPGYLSVIARIKDSNGVTIAASRYDTVVVPASFGSGTFGKGDRLPKSIKNSLGITEATTPTISGRAYPKRKVAHGKLLQATSTSITGALKATQLGKDAGFEPKITVTLDPSGGNTTTEHTSRLSISDIEVDPLTHEVVFDISGVTVGDTVKIVVEDANGVADPEFAWALYTSGLEAKSDLSGSCVTNEDFLGGSIATDVTNGLVHIENVRTGTIAPANTDSDGNVIFYTDTAGLVVNRFDAEDGDTIKVFTSDASGAYSNLSITVPVVTDTGSILSSDTDTYSLRSLPDESAILKPRFPTYVR